jgi:hypothetical protein
LPYTYGQNRFWLYPVLTLVGVLGWGPPATAEQTVFIAPGEHYVLIENGSKRTTDGKGNARILLDDGRVVRIDSKGVVEIRDAHNKRIGHGRFLRWHSLSAGRVDIRQGQTTAKEGFKGLRQDRYAVQPGGLRSSTDRQGAKSSGLRSSTNRQSPKPKGALRSAKSGSRLKPPFAERIPGKTEGPRRLRRRIDVGAQVLIYR